MSITNKIPKIIHYCWFGKNPKSEIINQCLESWKKYLPEYEIIEWNEDNFDINSNSYARQAYECKKWAFVSDFVRLSVLYEYGGIYLDTDTEITNNIDNFLNDESFLAFETDDVVAFGIMGATKNNFFVKRLLNYYNNRNFKTSSGDMDLKSMPRIVTDILLEEYQLQVGNVEQVLKNGVHIYPRETFYVFDTKVINYSIHHYNGSWLNFSDLQREFLKYKKNYSLISELMLHLIDNKTNENILNQIDGYKRIIVYGIGNIGKVLVHYFNENSIFVNCIIDKFKNCEYYHGIPICNLSYLGELNSDDLVIITASYDFYNIYKELKETCNASIISIEELLNLRILY